MALTKKEQDAIIKNKMIKAASKTRTATKVIIVVLLVTLLLTGGTYGVLTFINANSMQISIKESNINEGLSLSKIKDSKPEDRTTNINMEGPEDLGAYTYTWLNMEADIFGYEGGHHGASYIAYSFYLVNNSPTRKCTYTMGVEIVKNTLNTASAIRVMIIEDEDDVENRPSNTKVYAQSKADGTAEYVAYDDCKESQVGLTLSELNVSYPLLQVPTTTPFLGEVYTEDDEYDGFYVMKETGRELSHAQQKKFTVVIWFEGTDQQCVNDILGGKCTINFWFDVEAFDDDVEYYG